MANRILSGQVQLQDFFVIFHVVTNDIGNKSSFEAMLSDYGLVFCGKANSSNQILISAIHLKRQLLAKTDGGLHLNTGGTSKLRYYSKNRIAFM